MSEKLTQSVIDLADKLKEKTIKCRRDLHQHPESGWTEFRTSSIVATTLKNLGYEVLMGSDVIDESSMMGVPDAETLKQHQKRAIEQGANPDLVAKMDGGKTGVVGILKGSQVGPTIALRFDMDALDIEEVTSDKHVPHKLGFASINKGVMHACGHDGHTSVGLAVAEIFTNIKDEIKGTIKLVFQPAEEGVRGARAMVSKGVVDDVDIMLGFHLGFNTNKTGMFACNITDFLATSKFDAEFIGVPAHAGAYPHEGKNALLAAASASLNLHAISRHGEGASRINVGILNAGNSRNAIPQKAILKLETRGTTSKINQYMIDEATRIIKASADMYDVKVNIKQVGFASAGNNSQDLVKDLQEIAVDSKIFDTIVDHVKFGASEDYSCFMEQVQQKGGKSAYMMVGSDLPAQHHDDNFDIDEVSLTNATKIVVLSTLKLLNK